MNRAPAVCIVDSLLQEAYVQRASDIHLEPLEKKLRVRFRIDGMLFEQPSIAYDLMQSVIARIKVLSLMNIAERRLPQDGKFYHSISDHRLDIRVATFPTVYGEKVVMRLLDQAQRIRSLEELGFPVQMAEEIQRLLQRDWGFYMVTGPTGSGKTTTLYAMLNALSHKNLNIVTLEDPIEYTIDGIIQGPINADIGFTFEKGLRSILRQDPDVILVGEIRDVETARVALQAALTGHIVLSTVHTHDAPSAVIRLLDMGIERFLVAAALTGVISQRLVQLCCADCKQQTSFSDSLQALTKKYNYSLKTLYNASGCDSCDHRMAKGRTGVFEMLTMNANIRKLLHQNIAFDEVYQAAYEQGYRPLIIDAFTKAEQGLISDQELVKLII